MVAANIPLRRVRGATTHALLKHGYLCPIQIRGQGQPLIVVPGLAGGIGLLEPLVAELSQSYQVISYALRGEEDYLFDRSHGLDDLVDDLAGVVDHLRLERPALMGVSFGAAIALEYATRWSRKLSFLVVQGGGSSYQPGLFGDVARQVLDSVPLPADSPFVNQFFCLLMGSRRRAGDLFDFIVRQSWLTDQSVMAHRLSLLDHFDIREELAKIVVPTLALGGERDLLVDPREAQELAARLPLGEFHAIPQAGHLAFVTHTPQMAQHIRQFEKQYQLV